MTSHDETYPVRSDTVLPDEPGHMPDPAPAPPLAQHLTGPVQAAVRKWTNRPGGILDRDALIVTTILLIWGAALYALGYYHVNLFVGTQLFAWW